MHISLCTIFLIEKNNINRLKEFLDPLKKELDFTLAEGVPEQWNSWVTTAGVAAATAQAS